MTHSVRGRRQVSGPRLRLRRFGAILCTVLLALVAFAAPVGADSHQTDDMATDGLYATVQRSAFTQPDESLGHNIPDLMLSVGDAEVSCDFLTFYRSTGDVARWGYATSEVITERTSVLTQYYQRGIVDCQERDGAWQMERRLVWDDLGGLGAEPDLLSEQPGLPLGPWGHRVSNIAIDGTPVGFLDFFNALGGLQAFGHPKSEARPDGAPGTMFNLEVTAPGVIRQYFQAAVLEHRPDSPERVHLRFLGDIVRDARYPFDIHQAFQSFRAAEPLDDGQTFNPEEISGIDALVARYYADRDALVAIYHATDGANWNRNDQWLSDAPLREWHGVTIAAGRVAELDLSQNQLSGEIPPVIGALDGVTRLALWGNQLRGSIPAALGDMTSLEWVALGINQLTGSIPPELGNLPNMAEMDFSFNQLSGSIPAEIGNLTNLTWLGLWSNRLSGPIPPELGNLTNLVLLDLDHNRLSGPFPAEFANLVNLERLWLHNNRLTGEIPSALGTFTNLQVLDVHNNELTGRIPPELGDLENLRYLGLTGNRFTGCVPAALAEVPRNDVDELGLPLCETEAEAPAGAA